MPAVVDNHKTEEFIGVDLGDVRVGLARGNSAARMAEPLKTIDSSQVIEELKKMADQNSANGIVIGLPRDLNGNETAQTEAVRQWVKKAKLEVGLRFYLQDEALTSRQAEMTEPKDAGTDAVAAAIILQDFLDSPESDRVAA